MFLSWHLNGSVALSLVETLNHLSHPLGCNITRYFLLVERKGDASLMRMKAGQAELTIPPTSPL